MKTRFVYCVLAFCVISVPGITRAAQIISDTFDLKDTRVVGGSTAPEGAAPYQVSIRDREYNHFCGGAIIDERWIVTAAHCIIGFRAAYITVGSNSILPSGIRYNVSKILPHPMYDNLTHVNDIGLLQVSTPIVFNNRVQWLPLSKIIVGNGTSLILTGWGRTDFPGSPSNTLQIIILRSITVSECRTRLINFNRIYDSQICTYTKMGEGACHGDSGGPLVSNGALVGVVSWGYPCAKGYPDVFTRVYSYLAWLRTITGLRKL